MKMEKELTRAEEQVMQLLWKLNHAFVKDLLEQMPTPKPAYNTVSTIVRILAEKGFVSHQSFGKTHRYYPLISKDDYAKQKTGSLVQRYFDGSAKELVSFFANDNKLDIKDLDDIIQSIKSSKK